MDTTLTFVDIKIIELAAKKGIENILFEREKRKEEAILELMKPRKVRFKLKTRTREEAEKKLKSLNNDIYSVYFNIFGFKSILLKRLNLLLKASCISNEKFCLLSLEDVELVYYWKEENRFE